MKNEGIEMLIRGMRDAANTHSPDIQKVLLCAGADALESLSMEFEIINRQHGQMTRILADDDAVLPADAGGCLEIKTSYERCSEIDRLK